MPVATPTALLNLVCQGRGSAASKIHLSKEPFTTYSQRSSTCADQCLRYSLSGKVARKIHVSEEFIDFVDGGTEMSNRTNITLVEARKKIWLVDSKGLVVKSRWESLQHFKRDYAHDYEQCKTLESVVKALKPTVLIGTSGEEGTFTKEVIEALASYDKTPVIFALSNRTSQSECTAEQAYTSQTMHTYFLALALAAISLVLFGCMIKLKLLRRWHLWWGKSILRKGQSFHRSRT